MNYVNELCSGCGRKFTENDDIVTCPVCGTPQHRECWAENGKCVNEHLHEDGFEWKPRHSEKPKEPQMPERRKTCLFCGEENPAEAENCENCGQPFNGKNSFFGDEEVKEENDYSYKPPFKVDYQEPEKNQSDAVQPESYNAPQSPAQPSAILQFPDNGYSQYEKTILGEDRKDFANYVRVSVPAYYKKFKKFENGKKFTFNFAAFIFGPLWFFFRKLYKEGVLFLAVSMCITLALYPLSTDIYDKWSDFQQEMTQMINSEEEISDEVYEATLEKGYSLIQESVPVFALSTGLKLISALAAALFADRLYKKKFLNDIKEVNLIQNETGDASPRNLVVMRKGGVSAFIPLAAYFAMQLIMNLLLRSFFE